MFWNERWKKEESFDRICLPKQRYFSADHSIAFWIHDDGHMGLAKLDD